ncbi:hypothetical protein DL96DRAFT_1040808 [Flagelloscypha sp. PMI_526]|nr:hypothetical protein DL96DRAFT_1040808 [Flagelloscypha sp. PMI_526]
MLPATLQPLNQQNPLDDTMGAMLLGTIISAMLYGASVLQTVYYFVRYPNDSPSIKLLVLITIVLDSAHMAAIMHSMYWYLITQYYKPEMLQKLVWSVIVESIFTGITAALVQFFYVWRVGFPLNLGLSKLIRFYRFGLVSDLFLTLLISLLIVATSICGTTWVVLSLQMETYEHLLSISPLTITINALSTAVDVLISGSLVIFLALSRTGFRQTDSVISKLILFFVNTGLVTSLCAVASIIALLARPRALIYAVFYFCIGRLYCNSLLAVLNGRENLHTRSRVRGGRDQGHGMATIPTEFSSAPAEFYHCRSEDSSRKLTIQIDTKISTEHPEEKDEIEMVSSGSGGVLMSYDSGRQLAEHPAETA